MSARHPRHQQRERALSLLYEAELKGEPPGRVLAELAVAPDPYVGGWWSGRRHRAEADRLIAAPRSAGRSSGWR